MTQKNATTGQVALKVVNDAMVAYASNPIARAVMTVIPFGIGSFADAFLGTAGSDLMLQRVETLIHEVAESINRIPAEKQDPVVTEADLYDAAVRAVRAALESGSREKVRLIAAALAGGTSVDRPLALDLETVMSALANLTSADLASAAQLASHIGPGTFPPPAELGPDALFFVVRLQAAGLLESVVLPASPPGSRLGPGYRSDPAVEYRFTPTFGRILTLLRAGGIDIARQQTSTGPRGSRLG